MSFSGLLRFCFYLVSLSSFYICFSLVCGESVTFDNFDNDRHITISAEEIHRRRMLVEKHLSKYEEQRKDWIETYHLSFSDSDLNFVQRAMPSYSGLEETTMNDLSSSKMKTDSTVENNKIPPKLSNINVLGDHNNLPNSKTVEIDSSGEPLEISKDRSNEMNIGVASHSFDKVEDLVTNIYNVKENTNERFLESKNDDVFLHEHTKGSSDEIDSQNLNNINELNKLSNIQFAGLPLKQIQASKGFDSKKIYSDDNSFADSGNFISEKISKTVYLSMQQNEIHSVTSDVKKTEIPDSVIKFKSDSDLLTPKEIVDPGLEESSKTVDKPENINYYKKEILPSDLESQAVSNLQVETSYQPKVDDLSLKSDRANNVFKMFKSKRIFSVADIERCPNIRLSLKKIISSYSISPHCEITEEIKFKSATNQVKTSKNDIFSHSFESHEQKDEIFGLNREANNDEKFEHFSNQQENEEISEHTLSTSKGEKNTPIDFNEIEYTLSEETLMSVSDELLKRKRLIKPFISSLNEKNEKWKETYDFSYKSMDSAEVPESSENLHKSGNKINREYSSGTSVFLKPNQSIEKYYIIHWLKRLYNKFVYYHDMEQIKITLSFSTNFLKDLKELVSSENFDISQADELLSSIIKNVTIIQNHDSDDFSFVFTSYGFYVTVGVIMLILTYSLLLYFPIARIIFPIIGLFLWHGWKMYSEKLAENHAIMSSSAPEYCQNILNVESGVFAHFKEYIRSSTHDDHCQKYFRALMTDPFSELSLPIVASDLISSIFLQFFIPLTRTLNFVAKNLFSGLGFMQSFYLFILIIMIFGFGVMLILIFCKYKFNLPFCSAEPTVLHPGSRVEDLQIKPDAKEKIFLKSFVSNKYDVSIIHHLKQSTASDKSLTFDHDKKSRALIRRLSI